VWPGSYTRVRTIRLGRAFCPLWRPGHNELAPFLTLTRGCRDPIVRPAWPFSLCSRPNPSTLPRTDYTHFPKENIRSQCNQHKVKGTLVNYKAAEKYSGNDQLELLVLFSDGLAWELHYDISVR
jgi:hypothetical protein